MPTYHGKFTQNISIIIKSDNHETCLQVAKSVKKQCEAWWFNVDFTEHKSARKGDVLEREIMIVQTAYSSDIVLFKESIRRVAYHLDYLGNVDVTFNDQGSIPVDEPRSEFD
tara:strand:+ start:286 stop:621 length:336 start_codon:yes stop_codon:yes gene_type:complete